MAPRVTPPPIRGLAESAREGVTQQRTAGPRGEKDSPLSLVFPTAHYVFQLYNLPDSLFISKECAGREQQTDLLGKTRLL